MGVCIAEELNAIDPSHPSIVIARLETSYNVQRTACPESIATVCSVEKKDFGTRVVIIIDVKPSVGA